MIVQDVVIAGVNWFFILTLVPMIRAKVKPPLLTSIPTGLGLGLVAVMLGSLGLWGSCTSSALVGCMWLVLAAQRLVNNRTHNKPLG